MIKYKKFELENGLRILVHEDKSTPLVAMNILYDVGSRDEDPESTGLAHLFEHLMFGGSVNIAEYDIPLQLAGGENNAFTNNDITDYYLTVPSANIETGFWLESDRMLELDFSQKSLDIQKSVVIEEFRQRYLNQPYGDAILTLRPAAYKVHPYRWPTIGRDINHVAGTNLEQIRKFFFSHYAPNNAILALAGNIDAAHAYRLAGKWFGPIERRSVAKRDLPAEPFQTQAGFISVERDVPAGAIYKAWHMCSRKDPEFFTCDLLTDILAGGESGRLNTKLVREKKLFSEINAFITSDIDPGLIIIQGKLMKGVDMHVADNSITEVLDTLNNRGIDENEMEKVRNRFESSTVFSNTNIMNKALNLAYFELLGDADLINHQIENFRKVSRKMVIDTAGKVFSPSNCTTLYYKSSRKDHE